MAKKNTDVCYVNEQGTLICDSEIDAVDRKLKASIATLLPDTSDPKLDLIAQLITLVQGAPIDDDCIALRTGDILGSVQLTLAKPSPVMLLFRYVALPGNILAAYYVQQNDFASALGALDHWSTLKPGC